MRMSTVLDRLWNTPARNDDHFNPAQISTLPSSARLYLEHAIALDSPKASAVWLTMHGTIRLKNSWYPFDAEQVISWHHGFSWHAKSRIKGLPVIGYDRCISGKGTMRWQILGIIPVITASGPDISRSAIERMQIEAVWIPTVLLGSEISWNEQDTSHLEIITKLFGNDTPFRLSLDNQGRVMDVSMLRWGNPENNEFSSIPFGGIVEEEKTFNGFTIPSKLRIGWYFGTNRFEADGEFFRCTVDEAIYR